VKHLPEADLADTAARTDGVIWVHLDHSDEHGMALLVEKINPRRDDLRDVNNRTPVPKLHIYPDHHDSAINGLARGSDGLLHFQPLKTFLTPRMLWTAFGPANAKMSAQAVTTTWTSSVTRSTSARSARQPPSTSSRPSGR